MPHFFPPSRGVAILGVGRKTSKNLQPICKVAVKPCLAISVRVCACVCVCVRAPHTWFTKQKDHGKKKKTNCHPPRRGKEMWHVMYKVSALKVMYHRIRRSLPGRDHKNVNHATQNFIDPVWFSLPAMQNQNY